MTIETEQVSGSSSLKEKGKNATGVGLVGVWATAFIQWLDLDQELTKNLLLGVPFFSVCITEVIVFIWLFLKPGNISLLLYRRNLEKTKKVINSELKNPNLSDDHKAKLLKKYEQASTDLIESFAYIKIKK